MISSLIRRKERIGTYTIGPIGGNKNGGLKESKEADGEMRLEMRLTRMVDREDLGSRWDQ